MTLELTKVNVCFLKNESWTEQNSQVIEKHSKIQVGNDIHWKQTKEIECWSVCLFCSFVSYRPWYKPDFKVAKEALVFKQLW